MWMTSATRRFVCEVRRVQGEVDGVTGDGTARRSVDDRSRHPADVELHLAAALPTAPDPQQLGDDRRLPVGGDGMPALAHPARRALRPHATVAAAEDARTTREGRRRTQDSHPSPYHVTCTA